MEGGTKLEFERPQVLLTDPNSRFYSLMQEIEQVEEKNNVDPVP